MRVVIEELKDLKSNKIYSEYQTAFNEFLNHLYKENKKNPKGFYKYINSIFINMKAKTFEK